MMKLNFLLLLTYLTTVYSIPCPLECICKPIDINDVDFTRMSYLIDCSNKSLNDDKLIYQAEEWTINEDKIINDDDDIDLIKDYIISIDLSNSLAFKTFTKQTIQLIGFSFSIQSLLLTNQRKEFTININSFDSSLYQNLKQLNLSSCCKRIPKKCQQLFVPLEKLKVLDISGSDMYKTCLNTPGTISRKLTDLYLRNNIYDKDTFSNTSRIFDGVRDISGLLDLQYSRIEINVQQEGNCLFNLFQRIKSLDLSSIKFQSNTTNTEINLSYLLKCSDNINQGQQLLNLYLRYLNLDNLPEWFTNERFPLLKQLDLSSNNIYSIDISSFSNLRHISLAYNPIEINETIWRRDTIYESINFRSTTRNQTYNLSSRLKNLFKITTNIDYSQNQGNFLSNLTNISIGMDFPMYRFSLNISQTNIKSFELDSTDLTELDISSNNLNELNLDKQFKLNLLDCSNQLNLTKVILNENLLRLNQLKCSNNSLKTISNFSLLKNEQLKSIDLSFNLFESLEDLFLNLDSRLLRKINLKSNRIQIVQTNIFHRKLVSLYEINLSSNQIHTIENNAFQAPNLQILDLTGNPLINIQSKGILTASLRLFVISNTIQQLTTRCKQSKSYDKLLDIYVNWFVTNGTLMNNKNVVLDKCLTAYLNETTINWIRKNNKHTSQYSLFYITIGMSLIGMLFGGIYLYRKNRFTFLARMQRYKQLDKNTSEENATEMEEYPYEDDEIVMNLKEPPYNKFRPISTIV